MSDRMEKINTDALVYAIQSSFSTHIRYIEEMENIPKNIEVTDIAVVGSFLDNKSTGAFDSESSDLDIIVLTNRDLQGTNIADSFRRLVNDELKLDVSNLVYCEVSKIDCVAVMEDTKFYSKDNRPSKTLIR